VAVSDHHSLNSVDCFVFAGTAQGLKGEVSPNSRNSVLSI
jgi:hypothetical protein